MVGKVTWVAAFMMAVTLARDYQEHPVFGDQVPHLTDSGESFFCASNDVCTSVGTSGGWYEKLAQAGCKD